MKKLLGISLLMISIGTISCAANIEINLDEPGARFSNDMYGLFFEEINNAGDGGLYAELVRNRSFEDYRIPEGFSLNAQGFAVSPAGFQVPWNASDLLPAWSLVYKNGSGSIHLDKGKPLNDNNRSSLRLQIDSPGLGIANAGYWGMNIEKTEKYDLSFYACAQNFEGRLILQLEAADGKLISKPVIVDGIGSDWKKYSATLLATEANNKARLVILGDTKGTVWFDMISLFPQETYKNRKNGLRPDLVKMMTDTNPKFLRWPGGCIVEGASIDNIFRWKDTIGDISRRPGKWNLWGYRRTDGFGYHEFLQLCEDTRMAPMFVCNAGVTCQWRNSMIVPMKDMQQYIDDALDAIEYAIGPETSTWGKERAKNGHPKPFTMKYVSIGNENWGPEYEERYKLFYDAIKKKYPNIQTIATARVKTQNVEMADDHFYNVPEWFVHNSDFYDNYDRNQPPIYVGEYCAQGATGNLYAGLAEAALLLNFERNAAVVRMVSYAPLFAYKSHPEYTHGAIEYDGSRVYGTSSYHVFSMLSNNMPNVVLPVKVDVASSVTEYPGKIGVGTWHSKAEFKEIAVVKDGNELFSLDSTKSHNSWQSKGGEWVMADGVVRRVDERGGASYMIGDNTWVNYTLSLKAKRTTGNDCFQIYFSSQNDNDVTNWTISGWGGAQSAIQHGGNNISEKIPLKIETGRWYDIRVELLGKNVKCYLDGVLIHNVDRVPKTPIHVAAGKQDDGDIIVKVCNTTKESYTVDGCLNGATHIADKGVETLLTAGSPKDKNSFYIPNRCAPVTRTIKGLGSSFSHTFKPYSLYILRLKTK